MQYINYNGNIYSEHEPLLSVNNRGFCYGDSFFETIAMFQRKMPLVEFHWSRIVFTCEVLSARLPSSLDLDSFQSMVLDLASVNELIKNARIRLQLFRKEGGRYLPEQDELGYVITMEKIDNEQFECGNGLAAGIREDCYKPVSMTSDLKSTNSLDNIVAAQLARSEGWDELIMLNHYAQICEGISSNIFIWKDNQLRTPGLDSGCVNGVLRTYLIALLDEQVKETTIEIKDLAEAEEVLLTNALRGVQWVKSIGKKTYTNKKAVELTALLNKNLLSKV